MTSGPTDWHQVLARVSGQLVRGEQRVTTHELLTKHLGVPVTDPACRRLRRVMRGLGWHGPRLMRWGRKTLKGYWRHPTVSLPAVIQEKPVAEVTAERESLAPELAAATRLALEKMTQILKIPTDRGDGNLLRAQTAAAGLAVNAQLRADETKMKQVRGTDDVFERIKVIIAEEEALAEERRKLREREGLAAARADMPTRDTNDRA